MFPHRYIQAVLAHDLAAELKQTADSFEQCERAILADERRDRLQQLNGRFDYLDLSVGQ